MIFLEKLPSRLELIPAFVLAFIGKIKDLPLTEEDIFHIRLSLEEALINAVKHGNKLEPDLTVQVSAERKGDSLVIRVVDQGGGFDFNKINDPTLPENLAKLNGRGVYLIKKLMDKVEFLDCGRTVKMIKFLKKEAGSGNQRREA